MLSIHQEGTGTIIKSTDFLKIISHTGQGIPYHHFHPVINHTYQLKWLKDHHLNLPNARKKAVQKLDVLTLIKICKEKLFRTQGESYLFPNYQRVPMEGNGSSKNRVRAFAKEQVELNKKFIKNPTVKP
ncbi:hypothetical protein O181_032265 [Austropuccinia psidii MF-1]|uniref:Uncharacterized protein n=1 Tax=Austropuccinia psidii MF-1 TaxID=1389203 RepID=A0A9Q3H823_9BASI|nr:hypothetical protein [Austropuccinia psidii MF-1]